MSIVLVGDLHLKAKKLADVADAWRRIVDWSAKNKVGLIIQAGDVFERPNVCGRGADTGTIYSAFLDPFRGKEKPPNLFLIPGNHDIGGPREKDALTPFDEHSWIKVCHKPMVTNLCKGLSVCAVPWVNRSQLVAKLVDKGVPTTEANEHVRKSLSGLLSKMSGEVKRLKDNGDFVLFVGHMEVTGTSPSLVEGNFEFSPSDLASVGADAYALGHIHTRQHIPGLPNDNDGYLGGTCQLNFGEEGFATGFRYLEIEGRKIIADKFIENNSSPKYFTSTALEGLDYRQGKDYIKIRGETKPETLPDGVIFERVATKTESRSRTEERLTSDSPVDQLLSEWAKNVKCEIPVGNLSKEAQELSSRVNLPVEAIGSLDRIDRIFLKNIASHEETDVDLSGFSGICGLDGPNGGGKTTILESILVGLYGHCPSRPSLQTLVRQRDGVKDALVEVDFSSSGKTLRVRREFRKTKKSFTHKAYLTETSSKDPIAGPKVDDVNEKCTEMVGDLKLVLSGVFSAQEEMDNLVNLEPAARKDLLSKLLGTEKYVIMSKVASKEIQGDEAWIEANLSVAEGIKLSLSSEQQDKKSLERSEEETEAERKKIKRLGDKIDNVNEALAKVAEQVSRRHEAKAKISEMESRQESIEAKTEKLSKEIEALKDNDETTARARVEELRSKANKLTILKAKFSSQQLDCQKLENEAKSLEMEASRMASERDLSYEQGKQKATEEGIRAIGSRATNLQEIEDKLRKIESETTEARTKAEATKAQASSLEGFPDVNECKSCNLAKDGLAAKNDLPRLEKIVVRLSERAEKGKAVVSKYKEDTAELVKSASSFPPKEKWKLEVLKKISKTNEKIAGIKSEASKKRPSKEREDEINNIEAEVAKLEEAEKALKDAGEVMLKVAKLEEKRSAFSSQINELIEAIKKVDVPEPPKEEALKENKSVLQNQMDEVRKNLDELMESIGRMKATIDGHSKQKDKLESLNRKIGEKQAKTSTRRALVQAFGRDGIPQLIMDGAIPRLQEITSDLLDAFEGRWSIRISSQREKASGGFKEVVDILVHDGFCERDVRTYSGGEKQVLKTIIRIAFATLQAERSGKGLKILVLDEATDKMETSLSDPFIKMLGLISSAFNQVFIVSHENQVLSSMPGKILLSLEDGTTKSVVIK